MSKTLTREEFIPLLKEVSDKLEKKEIRHEIPFSYRKKETFDFIKIVIPQETDVTLLEEIFNSNEYRLNGRFIDFYYKDFRFVFIRATETEFFTTFFYYSWDIVPTLMNVMLNKMGLNLTPNGLKYIASKNEILVSTNIKMILEFLDLDYEIYMKKGFNTLFEEVSFITTSNYFNLNIFKEYKFPPNDFFAFEKNPQYDYAMKLFNEFNSISFEGYDYNNDLDTYLLNIDSMFPGTNFLENVLKSRVVK